MHLPRLSILAVALAACAPVAAPPPDVDTPLAGAGQLPLAASPSPPPPTPTPPAPSPSLAATPVPTPTPIYLQGYPQACPSGTPTGQPCALFTTRPDGAVVASLSANALGDVTVGFSVTGDNLRVTGLQNLVTVADGKPVQVAVIQAYDPGQQWHYAYQFHGVRGNVNARDDGTVYRLPYAPGTSHQVVQGWNGAFSHQGVDAIDWEMPEGTLVYAARGGLVVETRADVTQTGTDPALKDSYPVNAIYVRHDDGTVGGYLHLQHDGVLVYPGQTIRTGQVIGRSGNTGYSSEPHLHVEVQAPKDDSSFKTFPVFFQTSPTAPAGEQLLEGHTYTAF